eukprot:208438-Rhodomonas_salina.1
MKAVVSRVDHTPQTQSQSQTGLPSVERRIVLAGLEKTQSSRRDCLWRWRGQTVLSSDGCQ